MILHFPNGDSYHGDLINDKPNGIGLYRWADGSYYEGISLFLKLGYFMNGLRHGRGIWRS